MIQLSSFKIVFRILPVFFYLFLTTKLEAQELKTINIDTCFERARQNYPRIRQFSLLERSMEYSIKNANKALLPVTGIYGQATYQSEVTSLPVNSPLFDVPTISKDQYRLYGEIVQPLTNSFVINEYKRSIKVNTEMEKQKLEIELYQIKERILNLYFGILLTDDQIKQIDLVKTDLISGLNTLTSAFENGVALRSQIDLIKTELLKLDQKNTILIANRKGYTEMLSLFTGLNVSEQTEFQTPKTLIMEKEIKRPELDLFKTQIKLLEIQNRLVEVKNLPNLSLFIQGGYGRPALNMLNNDFKSYFIGGLRFSWNLSGFYTSGNEKKMIRINQQSLDLMNETFLFNTALKTRQQNEELSKYMKLMETDDEIISLSENVKKVAESQLKNGTITANDFLNHTLALDQARQSKLTHRIQFLMTQYQTQNIQGNY
ncbi:MAG: TolC family protein [Flavobacteriales bacterium]|nr:TolC family protein [Flavobacteriales bacterium]